MAWTPEQRRNHCRQIASRGGQRTVEIYGAGFMSAIGKIGFEEYAKKHHDGNRAAARAAIRLMHKPRVAQPVGRAKQAQIEATKTFVERMNG